MKIGNILLPDFPLLLAPMEDVSDPPFRSICKEYGADLMFTEFVSSEALIRDAMKSKKKIELNENERPIGVQIFGGDEEAMGLAAKIVDVVEPDLIDINFGCPVKKVVTKGAGAGVLKNCNLMQQLAASVIKNTSLPVTAKTRLGWDEATINILQSTEMLQDIGIQAITIHARTRAQMYKGTADWKWIDRVKNNSKIKIPIFGNGDIDSAEKAWQIKNTYATDGIMIGRAAIGNPWIFNEIKHYFKTKEILPKPNIIERIKVCKKHLQLFIEWKGAKVGILEMRRHYANYLRGYQNIKDFRNQLVVAESEEHLEEIFYNIQQYYTLHEAIL